MICPKCGREIPDGTVCPCQLEVPALSDNPALNTLKTIGSSPMFLAMAVLFSISALLNVFSSLGISDALSNIYIYAYQMGLDADQIMSMLDMMRSTSAFSTVLGSIPAILVAVAMWIHFATCKSRLSGNISTAGLTICKVLRYISLICMCLVTLLLLGCIALIIVALFVSGMPWGELLDPYGSYYGAGSYSDEEATIAVAVVLGVIALMFIFAMVLAITYQASFIRMINRTKAVARSGMADDRVSGYLTAMTCLTAAGSIFTGLTSMLASPMTGLAGLAQGAAYILVVVLLRRYSKEMNAVLYPTVPVVPVIPVAYPGAQPPQQPQPVQPSGEQPPQGPEDGFGRPPHDGSL